MKEAKYESAEDRLFDALREVFALDQFVALEVSRRAACQIASFVADVAVLSDHEHASDIAIERIEEMRFELSALHEHLVNFRDPAPGRTIQ